MNIKLLTFFTLFFALLIHLNYAEAQGTYNMCSGTTSTSDTTGTLYDSGGPSGNYSDNETCDFLISGIPGQAIILKFNSYQTRTYNDYMKVYDGTSASDPIIMMGNGENHPDSIVAFSGNVYVTWLTYSTFDLPLSGFDISWYTTSNYQSPATTYCLPAYQSAGPNPNYIEDLWMADLRATTDQGLSQINPFHCAFYNDYSSDTGNTEYDQNSTRLIIGQTQTLHISTAAEPGQTCAAWIDYNNDGDFNDQNEKLGSSMTNKHLAYWNHSHIQFTIPDNVTPGLKRLRVMGSSGNPALRYGVFTDFDACNPPESSVGETEDFSVLIDANYCVPATNNDNTKFIIDSVALNGINHYNIAKPVSGYINTTTQPLSYLMSHGMFSYISPSATYTLSLKLKNVFQSTFINYWVDEDNDGEFEEYETPSHVDSIYLPTLGDTVVSFPFGLYGSGFKRLRIELSNQRISPGYVQESCHDLVYGEVIDYLVYFTSDFSIPSTASASSAGTTITSVRLNSTTYNNPNTADILYDYFDNPSYEFDLQPGKNNEIEIHSTVAGASYLSAFIDYDNDNDYDFDDIFENLRMNSTFGTSTSVYHASSGTYTDKFIFNTHALECAGPVRLHIVIGDTTNEAYLNGSTMLYGQMIDYRVNMANDANLATVADFLPRKNDSLSGAFQTCPGEVHFFDQSYGHPDSWAWNFPNGVPSSSNLPNPVIRYDQSGTYTATLTTSKGGQTSSASLTIIIQGNSVSFATDSIILCNNNTNLQLVANGNTNSIYTWYRETDSLASHTTFGTTSDSYNINISSGSLPYHHTYYVYSTHPVGSGNCYSSDRIFVSLNPPLVASVTGADSTCSGTPVNLTSQVNTGQAPYIYLWNNSQTTSSISTGNITSSTSYTLYVTDGNLCIDTVVHTVGVKSLPTISGTVLSSLCENAGPTALSLTGTAPGSGVYTPNAWFSGNQFNPGTVNIQNDTTVTITYTYTNSTSQCSNASTYPIVIYPKPDNVSFTLPNDSICSNAQVINLSGTYSPLGEFTINGGSPVLQFDPSVYNTGSETITYSYTNVSGCSDNSQQSIMVIDRDLSFNVTSAFNPLCQGDSIPNLTSPTFANFTPASATATTYCDGTGVSNNTFTAYNTAPWSKVIFYHVLDFGCHFITSDTIIVDSTSAQLNITPDYLCRSNGTANFYASGYGMPIDVSYGPLDSIIGVYSSSLTGQFDSIYMMPATGNTDVITYRYTHILPNFRTCTTSASQTINLGNNDLTSTPTLSWAWPNLTVTDTDLTVYGYIWYLNGIPVATVLAPTDTYHPADTSGSIYSVVAINQYYCTSPLSSELQVDVNNLESLSGVSLYPNPAQNSLSISFENNSKNISMRILKCLDGLGRTVFFRSISTDESQITLDLSNLIPAVYYIQIESTDNTVTLPFVKM